MPPAAEPHRAFLLELFEAALAAVNGRRRMREARAGREHDDVWVLAAGKAAGAMTLGALDVLGPAVRRALGRLPAGDPAALRELLDRWEHGPIGLVRSYVRAMKSLVIMAEHDMLAKGAV